MTMPAITTYNALVFFAQVLILSAVPLLAFDDTQDGNFSFTTELIHRDSPESPFYNGLQGPRWWNNAIKRSVNRAKRFNPTLISPSTPQSVVYPDHGEYLMKLSIGTPPVEFLAIVDTGSDLVWTQCKPCRKCFNQSSPLFDPRASSTYRNLSCDSSQCKFLSNDGTGSCESNFCHYSYPFGDGSSTEGVLATDTVTLGSSNGRPSILPSTTIGCGTNNNGDFLGTGIVGLGQGTISLISRMKSLTAGKFSYCLVPYYPAQASISSSKSSKMNFGCRGVVSGPGVITTPMVSGDVETFYYLTLEAISVGSKRIESSPTDPSERKIVIDSGTTLTLLQYELYSQLESEVMKATALEPADPDDPSTEGFGSCYRAGADFKAPTVIMHFTGADVKLTDVNVFPRVSEDIVCFGFGTATPDTSIYGNTQQMNFLIGYDLQAKTVSFKHADCTNY